MDEVANRVSKLAISLLDTLPPEEKLKVVEYLRAISSTEIHQTK